MVSLVRDKYVVHVKQFGDWRQIGKGSAVGEQEDEE